MSSGESLTPQVHPNCCKITHLYNFTQEKTTKTTHSRQICRANKQMHIFYKVKKNGCY